MSVFAAILDNTGIELVCKQTLTISNFCLEDNTNGEFTTLFLKFGEQAFAICHFNEHHLNLHTKLRFSKGEKLCLFTSGPGKIHAIGNYKEKIDEDDGEIPDGIEEDDEEKRNGHMG
ncbi:uncharacterized protein LOC131955649 [Physella acuta]|uniref:uncharacterized protein LOC131955649 n=1 Tax=Physella acuta TaxID=109671 RepID=UPI0027DCBAAB|nr:uncharacterized protein LOC131955649 [Physella acuta]